ncbi:MAG: ABC-2 transporter permease [Oliverpabstia sp.]
MKGLLIKDFKLMKNQKQFFLMILFFCIFFIVINGNPAFMISYLMIMCSFFTLSTISYDDFDHGMGYIFTLPVTRKIYVTEKYVFGLLSSAAAAVLSLIVLFAFLVTGYMDISIGELLSEVVGSMVVVLLIMILMIPVQLKFGSEKGRVPMLAVMAGAAAIGFAVIKILNAMNISVTEVMDMVIKNYPTLLAVGLCILLGIASIISFVVSLRIMRKKQF